MPSKTASTSSPITAITQYFYNFLLYIYLLVKVLCALKNAKRWKVTRKAVSDTSGRNARLWYFLDELVGFIVRWSCDIFWLEKRESFSHGSDEEGKTRSSDR